MDQIMIDLETLGTGDGAAIIQIGACRFDIGTGEIDEDTFLLNIRWDGADFGTIEPGTLAWWLTQDEAVREKVFDQNGATYLAQALTRFSSWIATGGAVKTVWAKGADFDVRLLRQACERNGINMPFQYWKGRDMRTIVKTLDPDGRAVVPNEMAHDALADCKSQVAHLVAVLKSV